MTKEQILTFLSAGRAVFTLRSKRTGDHYTFRIERARCGVNAAPAKGPLFFASVSRGVDEWVYLGIYSPEKMKVFLTKGSRVTPRSPSLRALNWFLQNIESPRVEFMHVGRCGRCGRTLTHPESIASGLGPECSGRGYARPSWHATDERNSEYYRRVPPQVVPPQLIEQEKLFASADACTRALDAALDPPTEPNLVVPLLLSLKGSTP